LYGSHLSFSILSVSQPYPKASAIDSSTWMTQYDLLNEAVNVSHHWPLLEAIFFGW
jgi:hypothetical protein